MIETEQQPRPEVLKRFHRIDDLSQAELQALASRLQVYKAPRGTRLLELGNKDDTTLYLIEGEVELLADDGNKRILNARDNAARRPISRLRPSQYRVTALGNVSFLLIDNDILDDYLLFDDASSLLMEDSYSVAESSLYVEEEDPLMARVFEDLYKGHLVVPSLPDVAEKVGRAILAAGREPRRLSNALMLDPALAAKTIRALNADLPSHHLPVNTVEEAVEQLGSERVISLVVNCVLRETLRHPVPMVAQRLREWWEHSIRVSSICYVLARLSERFDPDLAALAGLLHRVGEAVLLDYANDMPESHDEALLDKVIAENSNEIGRILLSMWNLSPELVSVVSHSGNLMRDHNHAADYADIVLVAERHASIGQPGDKGPAMDQMPAFQRLGLSEMSPEFSLQIVEAAKNALEQADRVLAA